uniref:Reverse transcriptase domain-containing protein n=1 Tax=Tanacetum cinerariifolium TaxID=118510 RepID=A0A6L2MJL3_TANCI|nr:reverse transcriptase domain-containing protein [Tanacetum cinerariifolium]
MDKENPWGKDGPGKDVELRLYRSMIGSLMYLTAFRPDIMFAVCACARHQMTPKECHLHAVKRIFRYLKGHPKLGLWYPTASPFDLVAYSDSDYGGASQDRKSTTGGSQFLGRRNLFPPLDNPELTIRRRSCSNPTLLNNSEMVVEGPGDLPVPDLRTMKELCQPSLNGRGDDANKHLDKFPHVTQSIKVNGVNDDALFLYLFPHSLTHHATAWFDRLRRNSINTFEHMAKMFLGKYLPPSMVTKLRNKITNFRQRPNESLFEAWERYMLSIDRCPNHKMLPVTQIDTFYNGLTLIHRDTINAAAGGTFMKRRPEECYDLIENMTAHHNDWDTSAQRSESSSSITSSSDTEIPELKAEMAEINKNLIRVLQVNQQVKAVTSNCETCGGPHSFSDCPATISNTQNVYAAGAYQCNSYQPQGNRNLLSYRSDNYLGPPGIEGLKLGLGALTGEATGSMIGELTSSEFKIGDSVETTRGWTSSVPTLLVGCTVSLVTSVSRSTNGEEEVVGIVGPGYAVPLLVVIPFRSSFGLVIVLPGRVPEPEDEALCRCSYSDAKVWPIYQKLFANKDRLSELIRTPLNKHCSTVLLKKLPEKLGDPGKFLISCDFPEMAECLALADLGASINLMPLCVWNKLSLSDLSPTCMTLELADRLISHPVRVAEDVFVKVGTFHFPADFVVVDFDDDPQTSRYSANYNDMTENRIDVIDMACEDDFLLEEVDALIALEDDPTSPEVDQSYLDTEEAILLLEAFLNDDPSLPPPNQGIYMPGVRKELKICKAKSDKSSIDEPLEVELKDLPPHLEYVFLEGDDKLLVIITKDLSMEEKTTLMMRKKYILVAVDYLSKWVEAKALPTNNARVVCKFLKNLFARFGTPRAIINDRGTHFCNDQFAKVMLKKVQLNELNDLRDLAYENSLIYEEKTKKLQDSKIKDRVFNIDDRVLLFNSRLKIFSSKLKSRWSGPFTISHVFSYGTVDLSQPNGPNFKVNGHRLKHYFGEDVPKIVVPDLQTFPKDH